MERHGDPATRIVGDPYAELFLGRTARAALSAFRLTGHLALRALRYAPGVPTFVVARHRFADVRAGRPVFELDFLSISRARQRILARATHPLPRASVKHVPIDFLRERIDERQVDAVR